MCGLIFSVVILWLSVVSGTRYGPGGIEDVRIVRTTQGAVRGHRDPNTDVFTFCSIPYATVPTKSQRFKAPLPGPTWLHTLDAVDKGIICPQVDTFLGYRIEEKKTMQEDCLIVNVYVPNTTEVQLPVVIFVHGGGYQLGFSDLLSPMNFVKNKKFIAVTFNYRLGLNGFLCLGTDDIPGNAGLKDQLALLRWVNINIASFGGNPDDVTITGASSGSMSVELLMLSKTTRGLFSKVIPDSGSGISVFSLQIDPLANAINYAKGFGFNNTDDINALEKFFKDLPVDMFLDVRDPKNSSFAFVPCVERNSSKDAFLNEAPYDILRSGNYEKLPILFGFADMEGIFKIPLFETWKKDMNTNFSDFLPADLQFESKRDKEKIAKNIKEFYFSDKTINDETILDYINFFTDIQFVYAILRSVKLHVEAGHDQVYLYEYSFVDENVPLVPHTNFSGATHCSNTHHVLDLRKSILNPKAHNVTQEYKVLRDIMQEMWYNFIKTGKPVPEGSSLPRWPAVGKERSPHMSLGTKAELRGSAMKKRAEFWDIIYSRYYRVPVAPSAPSPNHYKD